VIVHMPMCSALRRPCSSSTVWILGLTVACAPHQISIPHKLLSQFARARRQECQASAWVSGSTDATGQIRTVICQYDSVMAENSYHW
jgi:hypothetical protein